MKGTGVTMGNKNIRKEVKKKKKATDTFSGLSTAAKPMTANPELIKKPKKSV